MIEKQVHVIQCVPKNDRRSWSTVSKCDRVNLRGNRAPDPWHMSPHSKAINPRQFASVGIHTTGRQVKCCHLVVGSATHNPPRNGTSPRVLTCTFTTEGLVAYPVWLPHVGRQYDRVNLRGNRTPDPWHTSPHSKAINQRQLPVTKGFGQCRHSCYRQTQVKCCRLVVGSATKGTR